MTKLNPFTYFNADFPMDDIKIVYMPQQAIREPAVTECAFHYYESVSPDVARYIDRKWADENAKKPLQNEPIVSVRFVNLETGDLETAPMDYKAWKTTGKKDFYDQFGNKDMPNPLNVQALVQTKDDQLILGPRPGKETLQVPGGMLKGDTDRVQNKIAPAQAAVREFQEEVAPVPVNDVTFLGTSFYAGRILSTLFMTGKIELSAAELKAYRAQNKDKIKDFDDLPDVTFVPAEPQSVSETLKTAKMQETAYIALLLFGHQQFGKAWFNAHCPDRFLADHLRQRE